MEILLDAAMKDPDENVRYTAIKKIKDDSYLEKIVRESLFSDSVRVAIKNIGNIETLAILRMTAKFDFQKEIANRVIEIQNMK